MYGINSNSPAGSVFSAPKCTGSYSGRNTFTSTAAAVVVGVCPAIDDRDVHFDGVHVMAHEYIHMVQSAFMPGGDYGSAAPCWMVEGEAEWGAAAVSETFPDYRPSAEQIANMHFLAELLQATYSSHWIEVAELFREAGDFNASIGALKLHTGPKDNFYKSVLYLSIKNQTSPGRFRP